MADQPYFVDIPGTDQQVSFTAPDGATLEQIEVLGARALRSALPNRQYQPPAVSKEIRQAYAVAHRPQDSISAVEPSILNSLQQGDAATLRNLGFSNTTANQWASKLGGVASLAPGIGDVVSADDARRAYQRGDYLEAAGHGVLAGVGLIPGGGDAVAAGGKGALAMFLGRKAKTADLNMLKVAEEMAEAGADHEQIWDTTGWFQGADGQWRFEVPDTGLKVKDPQTPQQVGNAYANAKAKELGYKNANEIPWTKFDDIAAVRKASNEGWNSIINGQPASDLITHPEVAAAYPEEFAALRAQANRDKKIHGSFDPGIGVSGEIRWTKRGRKAGEKRSTVAHELQHFVQNIEGFSSGSMVGRAPAIEGGEYYGKMVAHRQRIADMIADPNISDVSKIQLRRMLPKIDREVKKAAQYEGYRRVAGEVEARNVQERLDMPAHVRAVRTPESTEDIPREDQFSVFGGGQSGMFLGPEARNADLDKANTAEEMLKAGVDRYTVLEETGWFRGDDGRMRFEIDDRPMTFNRDAVPGSNKAQEEAMAETNRISQELYGKDWMDMPPGPDRDYIRGVHYQLTQRDPRVPMRDVVDHPELFENYPRLGEAQVAADRTGSKGSWDERQDLMRLMDSYDGSMRSTALHELQHGVQGIEGFSRGGSSASIVPNATKAITSINLSLSEVAKRLQTASGDTAKWLTAEYNRLLNRREMFNQQLRLPSFDAYQRLGGEVESRATETRAFYNPHDRVLIPPWETAHKVPPEDQFHPWTGAVPSWLGERTPNLPPGAFDDWVKIDPDLAAENRVRFDNPGGDWLGYQRERAATQDAKGYRSSGAITAYGQEPLYIPPELITPVPGARGERRIPGEGQYDRLFERVQSEGFNRDARNAGLLGVDYLGNPYVLEGNTRAAVGEALGIPSIPFDVRWYAGGEERAREGWRPEDIEELARKFGWAR